MPSRLRFQSRRALGLIAALVSAPLFADGPAQSLNEAESRGHLGVEPIPALEAPLVVLENGTIMTAAGPTYAPGYVVLEGGKIRALGVGKAPAEFRTRPIDLAGRFVTPGLIDAHSHLGVYASPGYQANSDGNEATSPVTAGVWAEHSIWPQDPGFELAAAGGVTSMLILPGSANLIGGRGVSIHNLPMRGARAMRLSGAPDLLKMACGENPKRVYGDKGGAPSTRMGNLRGQREAFLKALEYRDRWRRWEEKKRASDAAPAPPTGSSKKNLAESIKKPDDPGAPPDRDLMLETLVGVIEGRILPEIHCYRADDMLAMIQLADEIGFKIRCFHHALEAYKIRDVLAAKGIAVATWADWWGFKAEAFDGIEQNLALLNEAGVHAVLKSDSAIDIQRLNQEAGKALAAARRAGIPMTKNDALRMVTFNPAWAMGVDDQIGSLEVGKRADLVVWDHHPLSVYARAQWVFIDGALRYDATRSEAPWSDFMLGQEIEP